MVLAVAQYADKWRQNREFVISDARLSHVSHLRTMGHLAARTGHK